MGIKCSLFGHAFDETTVERDREEQGSEVVITIRELETCKRCGETRVVSENKEVTTIETPDDVSLEEETAAGTASGGEGAAPQPEAGAGAEIVDAEAGEPVETTPGTADAEDARPEPAAGPTGTEPEAPSAEADDGVILEDDEEEEERERGEWPEEAEPDESDDQQPPVPDLEPETEPEPEAETQAGDAGEGESEPGSGTDSAVWSEADPDLDADRTTGGTMTVPEGTFRCGECGFTTPVDASSLREGDYCPECHRGTLVIEAE